MSELGASQPAEQQQAGQNLSTVKEKPASFGELHYKLLEKISPPSILVSGDFDILHISENAGRFLQIPGGELTGNLLKTINPSLRRELRAALFAAEQEKRRSRTAKVKFKSSGGAPPLIAITVNPVEIVAENKVYFLVVFETAEAENDSSGETLQQSQIKETKAETIFRQFERDLEETGASLHLTAGQYETAIEELRAPRERRVAGDERRTALGFGKIGDEQERAAIGQRRIDDGQPGRKRGESSSGKSNKSCVWSAICSTFRASRRAKSRCTKNRLVYRRFCKWHGDEPTGY